MDMMWMYMIWIWYDMMWYELIWYDMIRYDTIRYDMTSYDTIRYDTIWYAIDALWCEIILHIFLILIMMVVCLFSLRFCAFETEFPPLECIPFPSRLPAIARAVEGHPNLLKDEVPRRATTRALLDSHASRWPMVASHIAANARENRGLGPFEGCLVDFVARCFFWHNFELTAKHRKMAEILLLVSTKQVMKSQEKHSYFLPIFIQLSSTASWHFCVTLHFTLSLQEIKTTVQYPSFVRKA